jgi:hypothetical protein
MQLFIFHDYMANICWMKLNHLLFFILFYFIYLLFALTSPWDSVCVCVFVLKCTAKITCNV